MYFSFTNRLHKHVQCKNCWAEYSYESRFSAASSKFSFNAGKERLNFSFLGGMTPGAFVELSAFLLLKYETTMFSF